MQLLEVAAHCSNDEILEQCVYEGNLIGAFDRAIMGSKTTEKGRVIRKDHEAMVATLAEQFTDEYIKQFPNKNKEKILNKFKETTKRAIDDNRYTIVFYLGKIKESEPFEKKS